MHLILAYLTYSLLFHVVMGDTPEPPPGVDLDQFGDGSAPSQVTNFFVNAAATAFLIAAAIGLSAGAILAAISLGFKKGKDIGWALAALAFGAVMISPLFFFEGLGDAALAILNA